MKRLGLSVWLIALLVGKVEAANYYLTVFAYQDPWNVTVTSHTFASFVTDEVLRKAMPPESYPTISWLPETQQISRWGWQRGRNFNLPETLAVARAIPGVRIVAWGPYEITPELYARAMARIAYLTPEKVWYKMLDRLERAEPDDSATGLALNCIHAVSDIGGPLATGPLHGIRASQAVVDFLRPFLVGYPATHPEVAEAMHLDRLIAGYAR